MSLVGDQAARIHLPGRNIYIMKLSLPVSWKKGVDVWSLGTGKGVERNEMAPQTKLERRT